MKRIILIILALTLVVISCKKKDDEITGPGGVRSWAGSVGGKTFTDINGGKDLTFNSIGSHNREYDTNMSYTTITTYSIEKIISEKRVIFKAEAITEYTEGPSSGETGTNIAYIGYELDDEGFLYSTQNTIEEIEKKFGNMSPTAFDKDRFTSGIQNWPNIGLGSIFVSKDSIALSVEWEERDSGDKRTNDITTHGYLRIGGKGRIDGGVHYQQSGDEPKSTIKSEVIDMAKSRVGIAEDSNGNTLNAERSYSYASGNRNKRIYILCHEDEERVSSSYTIYNFEYNDNNTNTIKYIAGDVYNMPKGITLEYVGEINP